MNYPVVIHKDADSDYGVTVPDLPGCFSAGGTMDEALAMAREAIELHLEGLIEDGQPVPAAGRIEDYRTRREYRGGTWAVVTVDPADLRVKAKRVNITMPERILDAVDRFAEAENETRSGLLVKAATDYMARASSGSARSRLRGRRRGAGKRGR
ncbi:MAG TPA: type II toxin-antitoxin system HicB family antitoxin [Phycisphaerae bacterium]|nr:type II toxin-antitoxin system HicB family antitoxin [Phycisphaerae bacterium]HUU91404.1 type II toxin-antitoxin system HicB family antitoxin [Phycisphaerae bacterium]